MKTSNGSGRVLIMIAGLVILAFLVMDFNSRMAEMRRLAAERERVQAELAGLQGTKAALEDQLAFATSEDAVEAWAYGEGHMIREGDVPVAPLAGVVVTPTPTRIPVTQTLEVANWQKWLALFFSNIAP